MKIRHLLRMLLLVLLCLGITTGCDDDDDEDLNAGRSRMPAEGLGSIVFENDSSSAWNLRIDGQRIARVSENNFIAGDYTAGDHLVHLDQHQGSKEFDRVVTVEAGVVTVIRVDGFPGDFDVGVFVPALP